MIDGYQTDGYARAIKIGLPTGLGDLILIGGMLNGIKDQYDEINISFDQSILEAYHNNDPQYKQFLLNLSRLLFSGKPYNLTEEQYLIYWPSSLQSHYNIPIVLPKLSNVLCHGTPLSIGDYIVLTTKVRYTSKEYLHRFIFRSFWAAMKELAKRYMIVILGERNVEMTKEYEENGQDLVHSIYSDIINNIPSTRLVDLTIPALGNTPSNIKQIQQDCLIMNRAKAVISIGIGGNLQMSVAVGNAINFHKMWYPEADLIYGDHMEYDQSMITKNPIAFLRKLRSL